VVNSPSSEPLLYLIRGEVGCTISGDTVVTKNLGDVGRGVTTEVEDTDPVWCSDQQ
jgi:hypothetical protein